MKKENLNELALFAGAGGGILGGHLLGWRTVCAVEWEPYPASVLCARQNDGLLPPFPIWDDVQTFDGNPWRGIVDVVSGGFPCQDISIAGGGGLALTEKEAECGEKWHGLLARFDQDTHLWRTVQCSLLEDLNESLQTLPQWGMTVGGELYLLPTLVQNISVKESGLWLTPSTVDIPTRSVESMEKRLDYRKKIGRNGVGAGCLSEQVTWSQDGPPIGYLTKEKMFWGTPKAQDSRHALRDRGKGNLGEQVSGLHNGGKLNPLWTEWLMGWWIGWTDLKPLVMDKCLYVQLPLGES
jgi:DNA (cytosine-5)-methyltransferase 1